MSSGQQQQQHSLIGGHAQYAKGAAEETIGNVIGAPSWQQSGTSDKQQGLDAMKAASADRNPQGSGFGKVEEVAGKVTGCEGMEREGAESKTQS